VVIYQQSGRVVKKDLVLLRIFLTIKSNLLALVNWFPGWFAKIYR